MKGLVALALVALGTGAPVVAQEPSPHAPAPGQQVLGFYVGTLPCADCSGIRTELTLLSDGSGRASYWLKETYLGKPEKDGTFESGGGWSVEPGAHDAKAEVYRLSEARSREKRFFLKVGHDELRMLDRSGRPIDSTRDHSLKRRPTRPESSR